MLVTATHLRRTLVLSTAALLLGNAVTAENLRPSWGTSHVSIYPVAFIGFAASDAFTVANMAVSSIGNGTVCNAFAGGTCRFGASVALPSGARIVGLDLEACDATGMGSVTVKLNSCPLGTSCSTIATVVSADTGCATTSSPPVDLTVDNKNNYYVLIGEITDQTISVEARAVRVRYQLQVSPAPATATFADVPTDYLYFRAVEALAASGITQSCGGGNFCPNQNVTRGEIAAFLARALGLAFPD